MTARTLSWLVLFAFMGALALRIHGQVRSLDSNTILREQSAYQQIRHLILDNYVKEVDEKAIFYGAMNGMAEGLDPHSQFLPPEQYQALRTSTSGQFEGIGIEFHPDESLGLLVLTPLQNTPAYRAGILPGDKIVKIDGISTEGMTREEASRRIKGPLGGAVRLAVVHEGGTQPVELTIVRAINEIRSVPVAELLEAPYIPENGPKIGYVQIVQFQQKTSADLDVALTRLEQEGMQALIMDLRQNPGGLLEAAEHVADLFLKDGEIVRVITRTAADSKSRGSIRYADEPGTHPDYPMAILVDTHSASASEVVAGALKDRGRAVLVGDKTYGKFSVQDVFKVPLGNWGESALKLTIAKYQTPSSPCIDGQGLVPDHLVQFSSEQQRALLLSRLQRHVKDNDPRNGNGKNHPANPKAGGGDAPAVFVDQQLKKAAEVLLQQMPKQINQ